MQLTLVDNSVESQPSLLHITFCETIDWRECAAIRASDRPVTTARKLAVNRDPEAYGHMFPCPKGQALTGL